MYGEVTREMSEAMQRVVLAAVFIAAVVAIGAMLARFLAANDLL